ncbi:MAG: D-2-hydroxyacid dehydrogenase [Lachnospiraceae bacterium]
MKIVFLEVGNLGDDIDYAPFSDFGEVIFYETTPPELVKERIKDADVIAINKIPMNEETLGDALNVKLICVTATGTNNIDYAYTGKRGIVVKNVKGYSTETVVQHTFALLFYLYNKLAYYDSYVKSEAYMGSPYFVHIGRIFHDLYGKTFGIVGLGDIGRRVAEVAAAFGCRVIYYSTSGHNHNSDYTEVSFERLLEESDIISIHAPLNASTESLFNYDAFCRMKNSAYLLNLGRGPIVNEIDLARALDENLIAGAGLDVLCVEPMAQDSVLAHIKDSEKLIITPHIAWASTEARNRLVRCIYENIRTFLDNGK